MANKKDKSLITPKGISYNQQSQINAERQKLDNLFNGYHDKYLKLFPRQATEFGIHLYDHIFENDISVQHRKKVKAFYATFQQELAQINYALLDEERQFSYDALSYALQMKIRELDFNDHLIPIQHTINCVPADFAEWGSGESKHPFKTVLDYENFLQRIDGFIIWTDTAIYNMRTGIKQGVVLPKIIASRTIDRIKPYDYDIETVDNNIFYRPIKNLPDHFSIEDKRRFTLSYRTSISQRLIPAYKRLIQFMEDEYLPECRNSISWSSLPNGIEWYSYKVQQFTTTDMPHEDIFELGLNEVERIFRLYEKKSNDKSAECPLKFYSNPDSLSNAYQTILKTSQPFLESLFGFSPKTTLEIKPSQVGSYYAPGSEDGSRPGIFFFYAKNLKQYPDVVSESLFLHEGIPGHHYQISIQRESALPKFRKHAFYSAFMEGWALYSESLGAELGMYDDPRQIRWRLETELWRAIRLVVDIGIHEKNWSIEDAIEYVGKYHFGPEMRGEFERYIAEPGQALSYKIGELKIRELKNKAELDIGPDFDLKSFHYEILNMGAVPLLLLEKK